MSRTGKIARLPRAIRSRLNRRLWDGESGRHLIDWLNSLPEVRDALARDFDGRPIMEPNLTEWKQGGYREWKMHQEALDRAGDLAVDAEELSRAGRHRLADDLVTVLIGRYAAELASWDGEDTGASRQRLRALRDLCRDVVELQRGQHNATRLKFDQARLDRDREKIEEDIAQAFLNWVDYPGVRDCVFDVNLNRKEKREKLRDLFGPRSRALEETPAHPDPLFAAPADPYSAPSGVQSLSSAEPVAPQNFD